MAQTKKTTTSVEPDVPYGDIINKLSRTLSSANRYLVQLMEEQDIEGIVPSHGDILRQLFLHDSLPMAALAEAIGRDPSTVTALVKKMVDAGYVETFKGAQDRRVTEVRLTDAGRKLDKKIRHVADALMDATAQGLTEQQLMDVCEVLEKMRSNFEERLI